MNNDLIVRDHNLVDGTTYHVYPMNINTQKVVMYIDVTAATGTTPTLDVTPQFSMDGIKWFDGSAFTQATGVTSECIEITSKILTKMRLKFVVASGAADADFTFDFGVIGKI